MLEYLDFDTYVLVVQSVINVKTDFEFYYSEYLEMLDTVNICEHIKDYKELMLKEAIK